MLANFCLSCDFNFFNKRSYCLQFFFVLLIFLHFLEFYVAIQFIYCSFFFLFIIDVYIDFVPFLFLLFQVSIILIGMLFSWHIITIVIIVPSEFIISLFIKLVSPWVKERSIFKNIEIIFVIIPFLCLNFLNRILLSHCWFIFLSLNSFIFLFG